MSTEFPTTAPASAALAISNLGPDLEARAYWSMIAEPGDAAAGAFTRVVGHSNALESLIAPGSSVDSVAEQLLHYGIASEPVDTDDVRTADQTHDRTARERTARDTAIEIAQRWLGHVPDEALFRRRLEVAAGLAVSLVDPRTVSGLTDLGDRIPHLLWVRGDVNALTALQERMTVSPGSAVVTEMSPGTSPTRWRFLMRNRLLAAVSAASLIVEAGARSGSLSVATSAESMDRQFGAVPGPVTSVSSAGCHALIREHGAICVTNGAEALELLT